MKKALLFIFSFLTIGYAISQATLTTATDFSVKDVDGNTIRLENC
jgi:hypothetical protein